MQGVRRGRVSAVVAVCAVLVGVTACSSDSDGAEKATSTTSSAEAEPATSVPIETTTTTAVRATEGPGDTVTTAAEDDIEGFLRPLLLGPDDLQVDGFDEVDANLDPPTCEAELADAPEPTATVGTGFESTSRKVRGEQVVRTYENADAAAEAYQVATSQAALSCTDSVDGAQGVTEANDLTKELQGDHEGDLVARVTSLSDGKGGLGVLILVLYKDSISTFRLFGDKGARTDGLPDAISLTSSGMGRILDAVGA